MSGRDGEPPVLPEPSSIWLAAATPYLRRFLARHFSALRIATDGRPPALSRPTIFYANHPGWWDPVVLLLLIRSHFADWRFHGPIDASALARYPWLAKVGIFGIETDSLRGARRMLAAGAQLLAQGRSGIALTAQGGFSDVRARPLRLKPGLSRLLVRHSNAVAFPVAIEYAFWNERLPEVLVRFGQTPIGAEGESPAALNRRLEAALTVEQDALARLAMARDAAAFTTLVAGRQGVGVFADLPQRLRAFFRNRSFDVSHAAIGRDGG